MQNRLQALKQALREPVTLWVVGSFVVACIAAAPLFLNQGFLNTRSAGDSPFLLFRLHQLHQGLLDGVFPVRWMPDAAFGLGYPFFNYYAALPFYFAAAFKLLGFSYVLSLKLTHLLGFIVAALGMSAWMWALTRRVEVAVIAATAFTFAPFHLVNVYLRGDSLSEFWAMAWYPLILLAIHKAAEHLTLKRLAWVALSFSALVMTHNVSALLFAPFVAVYATGSAFFIKQRKNGSSQLTILKWHRLNVFVGLGVAGIVGLLIAAWVWLPALAETDLVQLDTQTTGFFDYSNHFRNSDLVQQELSFNYTFGRESFSPFSIGTLQAFLAGVGTLMLLRHAARTQLIWQAGFIIGGLIVATLMITPVSDGIWSIVPLLPFAQFPWRFLSIVALFSAAATGFMMPISLRPPLRLANEEENRQALSDEWKAFATIALGVIMAVAGLSGLDLNFIQVADEDVTPERLQIYETYSGNIGTTIRFEYLPQWVQPRPYSSDILLGREPQARFIDGHGEANRLEASTHGQQWAFIIDDRPATVAVPILYFPGWSAQVDGNHIEVTPLEGLGYIQLDLEPGDHTVDFTLRRTLVRQVAEFGSLVGLLAFLFVMRPKSLSNVRKVLVPSITGLLVLVGASGINRLLEPNLDTEIPLSADFSQEAFHHRAPIRFFNQPDVAAADFNLNNQTLAYQLTWQDGEPEQALSASLSLMAPPQQDQQGAPSLILTENRSVEQAELAGEVSLSNLTPGMYFPWLEVAIEQDNPLPITLNPLTAGGQTRGDTVLQPIIIPSDYEAPTELSIEPIPFGPLRLIEVIHDDQYEALNLRLWWLADAPPVQHYAIALRLRDRNGNLWGQLDTQAGGAGLYPTGLWQAREVIPDNYQLQLERGTPPSDRYQLEVTLYNAATLEPVQQATFTDLTYAFVSRASCQEAASQSLTDALRVRSAEAAFSDTVLNATIEWTVCETLPEDYQLSWLLVDGDNVIWQIETPLVQASTPSEWALQPGFGGSVIGRYQFKRLVDIETGRYALVVNLLDRNGDPLDAAYTLGEVDIEESTRVFELPEMVNETEIDFGFTVRLAGYDVSVEDDTVQLELIWQSLRETDTDYQYFIHVFDPETETIVAQLDSMPRAFAYPTSRWLTDEVINETVSVPLTGVAPGEYGVAIGWYTPSEGTRLEAQNSLGNMLPDNRFVLVEGITVP